MDPLLHFAGGFHLLQIPVEGMVLIAAAGLTVGLGRHGEQQRLKERGRQNPARTWRSGRRLLLVRAAGGPLPYSKSFYFVLPEFTDPGTNQRTRLVLITLGRALPPGRSTLGSIILLDVFRLALVGVMIAYIMAKFTFGGN